MLKVDIFTSSENVLPHASDISECSLNCVFGHSKGICPY